MAGGRSPIVPIYVILCVIWGSTWLAIRIGLGGAPAFFSAGLRFALATAALLPLVFLFRRKLPSGPREWGLVLLAGAVLFTLDYGLVYWGEDNGVESGLAAILFATFVFQTAAFAHFVLPKERLTAAKVAGAALAFAGILLIFRGQLLAVGPEKLLPMLAIVFSATGAAFVNVLTKRWGHDTDPVSFTGFSMAVGAAGLLLVSLSAGEAWDAPSWPEGVLSIVYLALAGSVVTFVLYWWLLKRIEATSLSYIAMVTPIVAVLLGVSVGGESVDFPMVVGAAATVGGIYVAVTKNPLRLKRRARRPGGADEGEA